jgi:hypothetical protein
VDKTKKTMTRQYKGGRVEKEGYGRERGRIRESPLPLPTPNREGRITITTTKLLRAIFTIALRSLLIDRHSQSS